MTLLAARRYHWCRSSWRCCPVCSCCAWTTLRASIGSLPSLTQLALTDPFDGPHGFGVPLPPSFTQLRLLEVLEVNTEASMPPARATLSGLAALPALRAVLMRDPFLDDLAWVQASGRTGAAPCSAFES